MEGFVVDVESELEGGETEVGRAEEEDEEGSLGGTSALFLGWGGPGGIGGEEGAYRRREVGCAWYLVLLVG